MVQFKRCLLLLAQLTQLCTSDADFGSATELVLRLCGASSACAISSVHPIGSECMCMCAGNPDTSSALPS